MRSKYIKDKLKEIMEHSNCEKRHVACIITDFNGYIISVGVNHHIDGVCDCCTTKTAEHAELVALDALPSEYEGPLTAYVSHKPCENCHKQLKKVCDSVTVYELSKRLKTCSRDILEERETAHGNFKQLSRFVQAVKAAMHSTPNWSKLESDQQEALHMAQHKIGRILYGNPNEMDHWLDASKYLELIWKRMEKNGSHD